MKYGYGALILRYRVWKIKILGEKPDPLLLGVELHTHLTILISKPVASMVPFFFPFIIHCLFIFTLFSLLSEFLSLLYLGCASYCYSYKFRVSCVFIQCLFLTKFEGSRLLGKCTEWTGIRLNRLAKICVEVNNIHLAQERNVGHV